MKVLAFRPRRPSRAEILRLVARRRPASAGMDATGESSRFKGEGRRGRPRRFRRRPQKTRGRSVVRRLTELHIIGPTNLLAGCFWEKIDAFR